MYKVKRFSSYLGSATKGALSLGTIGAVSGAMLGGKKASLALGGLGAISGFGVGLLGEYKNRNQSSTSTSSKSNLSTNKSSVKDPEVIKVMNEVVIPKLPTKEYNSLDKFVKASKRFMDNSKFNINELEFLIYPRLNSLYELAEIIKKYDWEEVFYFGTMSEGSPIVLSYDFSESSRNGWYYHLDRKIEKNVTLSRLKKDMIAKVNEEIEFWKDMNEYDSQEYIDYYTEYLKFIKSYNF